MIKYRTLLTTAFVAIASLVARAEDCPGLPVATPGQTINFPIGGVNIVAPTSTLISVVPSNDNARMARLALQTRVSLDQLRSFWPQIIQNTAPTPAGNCQNRYSARDYELSLTQPTATGTFSIDYSNWWCGSANVLCPTISEPLRTCRQDASNRNFGTTVDMRIVLVPSIQNEKVVITPQISHSGGNISGQLAFLGSILGGAGLGALGTIFEGEFTKKLSERINDFKVDNISAPGLDLSTNERNVKLSAQYAEFNNRTILIAAGPGGTITMGGGAAPSSNITLTTDYISNEIKANYACFIRNQFVGNR